MLKIVHGNLLEQVKSNAVIMHGCNAMGVMSSGFAASVRRLYPKVYDVYKAHQARYGLHLGDAILTRLDNNLIVINCVTQQTYGAQGKHVDYEGVRYALKSARHTNSARLPMHMPFIGGGRGGGNHDTLMGIFKNVFEDDDATLWLFKG